MSMKIRIQETTEIKGVEYTLPNGAVIFVTSTPHRGISQEFFDSIDGWVCVSDKQYIYPKGTQFHWHPWIVYRTPTLDVFFSTIRTMKDWLENGAKRIVLHCDDGTCRSVLMFGAFLYAIIGEDGVRKSIVANGKGLNRDIEEALHNSNPLEYIQTHFDECPEDVLFLRMTGMYRNYDFQDCVDKTLEAIKTRYEHTSNRKTVSGSATMPDVSST